jgi:prevent-host-death family protein
MLKTTEWIVTTTEAQQNLGVLLKNARQRPFIITEDGRPSAYVVSVELFDFLCRGYATETGSLVAMVSLKSN